MGKMIASNSYACSALQGWVRLISMLNTFGQLTVTFVIAGQCGNVYPEQPWFTHVIIRTILV